MARPKLNSGEKPVRLRLVEAFLDLVKAFPADKVTVNMVVARAQCARGSFYYHFEDINGLIDAVIDHVFPDEIPQAMLNWFLTAQNDVKILMKDTAFKDRINKLCILVGPNSSLGIVSKVKKRFISAWLKVLGLEERNLPEEAHLIFEFVINGVVGIFSYRANGHMDLNVERCIDVVFPEIPKTFIRSMSSAMGGQLPMPATSTSTSTSTNASTSTAAGTGTD